MRNLEMLAIPADVKHKNSSLRRIAVDVGLRVSLLMTLLIPAVACNSESSQSPTEPTPISTPEPSTPTPVVELTPTPGYKLPTAKNLFAYSSFDDHLKVEISMDCTVDLKERIATETWDFGDGNLSTTHIIPAEGIYTFNSLNGSITGHIRTEHVYKKPGTYTIIAACVDTSGNVSPTISTIPAGHPVGGRGVTL